METNKITLQLDREQLKSLERMAVRYSYCDVEDCLHGIIAGALISDHSPCAPDDRDRLIERLQIEKHTLQELIGALVLRDTSDIRPLCDGRCAAPFQGNDDDDIPF